MMYFELGSFDFIVESGSPWLFEYVETGTFIGHHREHLSEIVSAGPFVDKDIFLGVGAKGSFEDFCWYLL